MLAIVVIYYYDVAMSDESMLDQAYRVVDDHVGRRKEIARDTGLGYQWLNKFAQRKIDDPGVNKIEKILEWGKDKAA